MIKSKRTPMNRNAGARKFNHDSGRTHPKNMAFAPKRGGWRL